MLSCMQINAMDDTTVKDTLLYDVLGVESGASQHEIHVAYMSKKEEVIYHLLNPTVPL